MLTFIVGATIVITLIGRGELIGEIGGLPSPAERARNLQSEMQESFRAEEQARRLQLIASGEADESIHESFDEGGDEAEDESKGEEKKEEANDK